MTARRYVVRLAREVRQEAEVVVWAADAGEAELIASHPHALVAWKDAEPAMPWVIENKANEP